MNTLIRRNLEAAIQAARRDTPVVAIVGPRQSGKTTLAQTVLSGIPGARYVSMEEAAQLAAARSDPDGFVAAFEGPVAIDEVQRAPDLFHAIKASVDRDRRPGRFLLTGSADILALPKISESLAGRIELHTLWPFSADELAGREAGFIDAVFADRPPRVEESSHIREDVIQRALTGGYPEVLSRPADRRPGWFASYVTTVLEREIRDIVTIEGRTDIPLLVALLASRTMSTLNASELARVSGMDRTTLRRYLALLELTYLVRRIRSWTGSLSRRLLRHPRIALTDTGLVAALQNIDRERLTADPALVGPLLENYVAMEIVKQMGWNRTRCTLYHFRSAAGSEVDIVLERADGRLVGIEVKATSRVRLEDFKGLRTLSEVAPRKFHRGILLYTGRASYPFGKGFEAIPISALWRA